MSKLVVKRAALIGVPLVVIAALIALAMPAIAPILDWADRQTNAEQTPDASPEPPATTQPTPDPTPTNEPVSTASDTGNESVLHPKCDAVSRIDTWSDDRDADENSEWHSELFGELVDTGEEPMATGTVHYDDAGQIIAYTVAAGDTYRGIADRFCTDSVALSAYNEDWPDMTIYPGDRLTLRPVE